jgi:mono/diheme cytochrome c family protein
MCKMKLIFHSVLLASGALVVLVMPGCSPTGGNATGHEFMPDMAHSTAYEANVYYDYGMNTWDKESVIDRRTLAMPRIPVSGTIARGFAGGLSAPDVEGRNAVAISPNGSVPYYYKDTEEERLRATAEIRRNPFPITDSGLARGKALYNIYCGICHGDKGDGAGYLVRDDGGVYPAGPANLVSEEFIGTTEGRLYHSIMYGKNVMGSYADKLSYEERWQVIHHIRALQATASKKVYNEKENTLTASATPAVQQTMEGPVKQ